MTELRASRWLRIDLTGSRLGPGWRSVVVEVESLTETPAGDERLRRAAADHYEVPIEQVGPVLREDPIETGEAGATYRYTGPTS